MLEGDSNCADAMFTGPLHISHSFPTGRVVPHFNINPASRALNIRARLGHLTGDPRQPPGSQWDPELQGVARRLQTALQKAADYIFRDAPLMEKSWKNVKALTWSAACDFSIIRGLDRLGATFPIHFVMHQQGQRWLINEYQLAAVMGLWRYTTFHQTRTSTPSKFASSQYPKRKVIQATDSLERTVAAIRLWITKNSQLEHRYEFCGSELEGAPFRLSAEASMQALSGAPWEPYLDGEFAEESHAKGLRVSLLSVQTTASFLEMMAQDIFTTFIFEVASIMDNVSDVSVRQPSISSVDSLLPNRSTASSELSNVHIDALARLLCESGLASEEAALMSIVPGFLYHAKLPTLDGLIARLLADAKRLRSEGQFEQGEAVLKRLLRICSPDHHEKVVRALGEHYRWALKSRSKVHRTFGLRSMETITHLNIQGAALSQKAVRALKDYAQLSEFLKKDPRHGDKFLEAKPLPMLEMESLLELRADEELPTDVRSRLKALLLVEKHNIRGRNSLAVQELLFVAIALGYIEVVDEIRAMNPNLLFELPSSELPSSDMLSAELQSPGLLLGGKQPLIIAVQQMLGSDKIDSSRDPTIIKGGSARTGVYTGFLAVLWAATQLTLERRVAGEAEDLLRAMLDWASIIDDLTDGQKNTPLMYTASSGNLAAVEILLECGVDFQVRNTAGETALSKAITKDLFSIAERILKEGQQTGGLAHGYLRHALSLAFRLRKQNFIELLLRNGADIDEPDERGETLLSAALQPSHSDGPELVSLLIKYGAMIQHNFLNILDTALVIGAPDWIRNLHARGYGVVRVFNHKHNLTELLEQRQRGLQNEALIKLLLELGVAVQGEDLNLAVRFRLPDDIVRLMLEKGAPTNAVLKDYGTPIQTLLRSPLWGEDVAEQERMLEVLITAGCDVNLDSPEWKATPLQIVCARSMFIRRVSSFRPPLDMADNDNLPTILLRAGAKVNLTAADIPGQGRRLIRSTPLELACLTGKAKVVRALLDAGADVNTTGGEFGPPLQAACMQFGQAKKAGVDIVRTLLAAGASTNTVSKPYGTALAAAAHSLMPEVVKVLLDAGADPALEISDQASCEYRDAWDAVHTPHGRLVESLRAAFDGMQTDPFTSVMLTYDSAGEKWDRIREVLTQHGIVRPAAEQRECPYMYLQGQRQTLHAQDDYIRLSPSNQEAKKKEGLDGSDKEETGSSRDSSRNGTSRLNSSGDRG
jgi:ankyrin repeat protein